MSHFAKRFWPLRFFSKAYWGTGEATPGEVTLSGQQAIAVGGTLLPVITILLTGQEASTAFGTLTPEITAGGSVTLSGQQASAASGTIVPAVEVELHGLSVTAFGGAFFRVQLVTEADLFAILVIPEIALATGVDSLLIVVIEPTLTALAVDVPLEAADKSDDLWAQQQVEELFAFVSDNDEAVIA